MWFRRDLRLADHPALIAAGADGAEVVPVFVVDPTFAASGAPRLAYLHDCLSSLDAEIRRRSGTGLVIRHGDPADVVPGLAAELGAGTVFVSRDYAPYGRDRDAAVAAALRSAGRTLLGVGSPYAVAPGKVRKGDGDPYAVFTPFSKVWRQVGWELPVDVPGDEFRWLGVGASGIVGEPVPTRQDPACELPVAGEESAHDLWSQFLTGGLDGYPDQRNLPGSRGHEPTLAGAQVGNDPSPPAARRTRRIGRRAQGPHGVLERTGLARVLCRRALPAAANRLGEPEPQDGRHARRHRQCRSRSIPIAGQPGRPASASSTQVCDNCASTGWMHNRVRMIVASFLVKDLHLPWQWGARWFMQHLVDGDLASNNHGWQWAAGTGTDAAPYFRVFNPTLQQERYDPDGDYVERWVAEPAEPMLDHRAERDEALRRLASIR